MRLTVNGKPERIEGVSTLTELLVHFDLAPIRVAIEVNRELVSRGEFDRTALREDDQIEIVTFVGGG